MLTIVAPSFLANNLVCFYIILTMRINIDCTCWVSDSSPVVNNTNFPDA